MLLSFCHYISPQLQGDRWKLELPLALKCVFSERVQGLDVRRTTELFSTDSWQSRNL